MVKHGSPPGVERDVQPAVEGEAEREPEAEAEADAEAKAEAEAQAKAEAAPKFAWPERDGAWWLETGDTPYDGPENQTLGVRCIYQGSASIPIRPLVYNNLKTIVQTDDYMMIYIEWMHWARIIRINDDSHNPRALATFDGDSIGRWEEDWEFDGDGD